MGFRGEDFAFDSPAAAAAGRLARLRIDRPLPGTESCSLADCRGRILAEAAAADRDSPAFDYSAMDGYAVRLADIARGEKAGEGEGAIPVAGEARIGWEPPLMAGRGVVWIVTGAAVPPGADAVIKREDVVEHTDPSRGEGGVSSITIRGGAAARLREGENIRRRGENAGRGEAVLGPGSLVSAAGLGALAAVGCVSPRVYARLRVAVITTGDELVPADQSPSKFQIRNSNGPAVLGLLASHSWIEAARFEHVCDDGDGLARALGAAIAEADAVVLTGGVSMGHRDPVRGAVEAAGGQVVFHGLPQRPGKPMLGAVAARADGRGVLLFGLPGNPVSAMVTCTRIVVPVLAACSGAVRWPGPPRIAIANPDGRTLDLWWHRLVRMNDRGEAELVDARGSGDIIAGGRSDGFIEVAPAGVASAAAAGLYPFYSWLS